MQLYTYLVRPPDGYLHPSESDIMPEVDAEREAIVTIRRLDEETGTVLYRSRGDPTGLEQALATHDDILAHEVMPSEMDEATFHLFTRFRLADPTATMLELADAHGLLLETPFRFTDDGALELTLAGRGTDMQDAVPAFLDAAEAIDVSLESVRDFVPEEERILSSLTEKQREVVETAVDRGYYGTPREVTHSDVAEEVGCSPSTAGEHLQKAENAIVRSVLR